MLLKVADVAHEEWDSLLECLEKSQGKSIQVLFRSVLKTEHLVQFLGRSVGRSSGLGGGLSTVDHSSRC